MIRPFRLGDLDRVMQLWLEGNLEAHGFVPQAYWLENALLVRQQLPQAQVLVYEQDGQLLGFAGIQQDYLAGIFVDRPVRSTGIGKQLLDCVKATHPTFTLRVYQENRRAVDFYRREGLTVSDQGPDSATGAWEYTMAWAVPAEVPR